jgi:hypothetical protein
MLNLDILDKMIAVVLVILGLTLFVQSLQALLKKVLKLKSLQLDQALTHLFHFALDKGDLTDRFGVLDNLPLIRNMLPRQHPAERDPQVKALYDAVTNELRRVGRLTWTGKLMLDSIALDDLTKIIGKVPAAEMIEKLFPDSHVKISEIEGQLRSLSAAIEFLKKDSQSVLSGGELAPLAKLASDLRSILASRTPDAPLLVSDIVDIRQVNLDELIDALHAVAAKLAEAHLKAQSDPASAAAKALGDAQIAATSLASSVAALKMQITSVRGILHKVDNWFGTIMQSFDERYARAMRTTTLVISVLVVIVLNANIVDIYRAVATNDARRALVLQTAEQYRKAQEQAATGQVTGAESPAKLYQEGKDLINKNINDYTGLGLSGPTWVAQIYHWIKGDGDFSNMSLDQRLGLAAKRAFGWLIMIMLLSAGAPFWQDTLESMFGLKNLLRSKSGTSNVEATSGAGQPKP